MNYRDIESDPEVIAAEARLREAERRIAGTTEDEAEQWKEQVLQARDRARLDGAERMARLNREWDERRKAIDRKYRFFGLF
jgi:hypothetical protein